MEEKVQEHTREGDLVFDPFSGRGTTILQALLMRRRAAANDINPVAYCVSQAKADTPPLRSVISELGRLEEGFRGCPIDALRAEQLLLPIFFGRAFHQSTIKELLYLRRVLDWRTDRTHRFIAALVLGSLHGDMFKSPSYFSNQMPRTISLKPNYSLKYWRDRNLWPQKREVFSILRQRAEFRLRAEVPTRRGAVELGDARSSGVAFKNFDGQVRLIVTSPPYLDVTNYEEDQWLRLWFLGHEPNPTRSVISTDDRHVATDRYWTFLQEVWQGTANLLMPRSGRIVCRLGAKGLAPDVLTTGLMDSLTGVFRRARLLHEPSVSNIRNRQTDYFRPGSRGCLFEIDYTIALC